MEFFPSFVWAIRDFFLDLEIDGKPCTPDEYMETLLKCKEGTHVHVQYTHITNHVEANDFYGQF